jgi:ABC-type transport system involved in multi-copper enzyme maturation permease subunit
MFADFSFNDKLMLGLLGAILLVVLGVVLFLGAGLFQARSLLRREFAAYFVSPIAYVVLFVFLCATGIRFYITLDLLTAKGPKGTEWPMQTMYAETPFWMLFLFIPPLLTMRLFAEERGSGTLEMLMTAPLRDWQVVLCKYLGCLAFYVTLWLPTLVYLPALMGASAPTSDLQWRTVWETDWINVKLPIWPQEALTNYSLLFVGGLAGVILGLILLWFRVGTTLRLFSLLLLFGGAAAAITGGVLHYTRDTAHVLMIPVALDPYPVLATYLGLFLAGAMLLALGLFVSSLVRNQLLAALIALALSLVFFAAAFWWPDVETGPLQQARYFFTVPLHFERTFTRGLIDTQHVVLYASLTLFCLFLTVRSLESRRWQ